MNKSNAAACAAALMVLCVCTSLSVASGQSVPSPWLARDVGDPAPDGSATFSDGIFSIDAAGMNVHSGADRFTFVYQAVSGDVDLRARVDGLTAANAWSKAGVMIRGGLAADAAQGSALVSASGEIVFESRQSPGGISTDTPRSLEPATRWVRLVRAGTTVTAYTSTDGSRWHPIASDEIALGATAYVGLAVTSRHPIMRTSATMSHVTLTSAELPEGQSSADVGSPAIAGRAWFAGGQYTIRASGADIAGPSDQFHYVYQPVTGDVDVVARVESLTAADQGPKAGVMIRESLSASSPHAMALISSDSGYAFQWRTETAWSDQTSGGAGTAPGWVRLLRTGTLFSAYQSADGTSWTSMGTATIAMNDTVYVGIAVTSHDIGGATTAVVDGLRITGASAPSNDPPAIILSAPSHGVTFVAPATLTVTASATDRDGSIASVEFYANATLIGRDASTPYSVTGALPQGTYAIIAVATDDQGASTISEPVSITVSGAEGAPRAVAFTASSDHDTLVARYVLEVYGHGATPGISNAVATLNLGKPAPTSGGEVTVDCFAFFHGLQPGSYIATVMAVGDGGSSRSDSVSFTR